MPSGDVATFPLFVSITKLVPTHTTFFEFCVVPKAVSNPAALDVHMTPSEEVAQRPLSPTAQYTVPFHAIDFTPTAPHAVAFKLAEHVQFCRQNGR